MLSRIDDRRPGARRRPSARPCGRTTSNATSPPRTRSVDVSARPLCGGGRPRRQDTRRGATLPRRSGGPSTTVASPRRHSFVERCLESVGPALSDRGGAPQGFRLRSRANHASYGGRTEAQRAKVGRPPEPGGGAETSTFRVLRTTVERSRCRRRVAGRRSRRSMMRRSRSAFAGCGVQLSGSSVISRARARTPPHTSAPPVRCRTVPRPDPPPHARSAGAARGRSAAPRPALPFRRSHQGRTRTR